MRNNLASSEAWIDQNGEARVSLDLDASRITLLDTFGELRYRVETNETQQEQISF